MEMEEVGAVAAGSEGEGGENEEENGSGDDESEAEDAGTGEGAAVSRLALLRSVEKVRVEKDSGKNYQKINEIWLSCQGR
jgi:hypothetical protein